MEGKKVIADRNKVMKMLKYAMVDLRGAMYEDDEDFIKHVMQKASATIEEAIEILDKG